MCVLVVVDGVVVDVYFFCKCVGIEGVVVLDYYVVYFVWF